MSDCRGLSYFGIAEQQAEKNRKFHSHNHYTQNTHYQYGEVETYLGHALNHRSKSPCVNRQKKSFDFHLRYAPSNRNFQPPIVFRLVGQDVQQQKPLALLRRCLHQWGVVLRALALAKLSSALSVVVVDKDEHSRHVLPKWVNVAMTRLFFTK